MLQTLVGFFVDKKAIGNYNYPVMSSCRQPLISHFSLRFQIVGSEFEMFSLKRQKLAALGRFASSRSQPAI